MSADTPKPKPRPLSLLDKAAKAAADASTLPTLTDELRAKPQQHMVRAQYGQVLATLSDELRPAGAFLEQHMHRAKVDGAEDPIAAVDHTAVLARWVRDHQIEAGHILSLALYLCSSGTVAQANLPPPDAEPPPEPAPTPAPEPAAAVPAPV